MAELNFNANDYAEKAAKPFDVHEEYKQLYRQWLDQCNQRKQAIAAATIRWREAVEAVHEAKMVALRARNELTDLKAVLNPPPPIKYV